MSAEDYLRDRLVKEASYHKIEAVRDLSAANSLARGMEKDAFAISAVIPWLYAGSSGLGIYRTIKSIKNQQALHNAQMNAIGRNSMSPWTLGGAAALGASIPIIGSKVYDYFANKDKNN